MMRVVGCGTLALGWLALVGCGSSPPPEPPVAAVVAQPAADVPDKPRPVLKAPRPPFLSLPDSAVASLTKGLFDDGVTPPLAFPLQRGPFGPSESVLVATIQGEGEQRALRMWTVSPDPKKSPTEPVELPVDNAQPLVGDVTLVWANSTARWAAVLLLQRQGPDGPVARSEVYAWTGAAFARVPKLEEAIGDATDANEIRLALQ